MYRIYRKIPNSFQGDFEFLSKSGTFLKKFYQFYGSFPGVSLMMREVSHVCNWHGKAKRQDYCTKVQVINQS